MNHKHEVDLEAADDISKVNMTAMRTSAGVER